MVCVDFFKLQTMIAFNKKLLRGSRCFTGGFLEKSPLAAGGKRLLFQRVQALGEGAGADQFFDFVSSQFSYL